MLGCSGTGIDLAVRLTADGEQVVEVPPKLSARMQGVRDRSGRKTDATDAHSVALVGTRMTGLRGLGTTAFPPAKRRRGYYLLLICFGDRLVGRSEPRIVRDRVDVFGVWRHPQ